MSVAQSDCPLTAGSQPDTNHQIKQKARTWYIKFQLPITAKIASINGYDEWKDFWKTGLDSPFRNKNLTKADIITISSQKNSSNLGSSDGSNHAMNELGVSDAGTYLICDGYIRGAVYMRYATVLKWLSPEQTSLDIRDLLLTPILDTKTNYCLHSSIHKFLSETSLPMSLPGVPADPAVTCYSAAISGQFSAAISVSAQAARSQPSGRPGPSEPAIGAAIPEKRLRVDVLNPSDALIKKKTGRPPKPRPTEAVGPICPRIDGIRLDSAGGYLGLLVAGHSQHIQLGPQGAPRPQPRARAPGVAAAAATPPRTSYPSRRLGSDSFSSALVAGGTPPPPVSVLSLPHSSFAAAMAAATPPRSRPSSDSFLSALMAGGTPPPPPVLGLPSSGSFAAAVAGPGRAAASAAHAPSAGVAPPLQPLQVLRPAGPPPPAAVTVRSRAAAADYVPPPPAAGKPVTAHSPAAAAEQAPPPSVGTDSLPGGGRGAAACVL